MKKLYNLPYNIYDLRAGIPILISHHVQAYEYVFYPRLYIEISIVYLKVKLGFDYL